VRSAASLLDLLGRILGERRELFRRSYRGIWLCTRRVPCPMPVLGAAHAHRQREQRSPVLDKLGGPSLSNGKTGVLALKSAAYVFGSQRLLP